MSSSEALRDAAAERTSRFARHDAARGAPFRISSRLSRSPIFAVIMLQRGAPAASARPGGWLASPTTCGAALRTSRTPRSQWCRCRPCRCRRSSSSPPPSSARSPARCGRAHAARKVSQGCAACARAHAPARTARAVRCAAPTERHATVRSGPPADGAAPQGSRAGTAEEARGSTVVRGRARVLQPPRAARRRSWSHCVGPAARRAAMCGWKRTAWRPSAPLRRWCRSRRC